MKSRRDIRCLFIKEYLHESKSEGILRPRILPAEGSETKEELVDKGIARLFPRTS
jgi:hypothetical protein